MGKRIKIFLYLIVINLYYSLISIATKTTSKYEIGSFRFIVGYGVVIAMLFVYALFWQQVLKKVPLSTAFMFKGSSIIFILLISFFIFNETVTIFNIMGCIIIGAGISLMFKVE